MLMLNNSFKSFKLKNWFNIGPGSNIPNNRHNAYSLKHMNGISFNRNITTRLEMHKVRYSMSKSKVTILYLVTGPSVFHI